jgi:hypothetical protein
MLGNLPRPPCALAGGMSEYSRPDGQEHPLLGRVRVYATGRFQAGRRQRQVSGKTIGIGSSELTVSDIQRSSKCQIESTTRKRERQVFVCPSVIDLARVQRTNGGGPFTSTAADRAVSEGFP